MHTANLNAFNGFETPQIPLKCSKASCLLIDMNVVKFEHLTNPSCLFQTQSLFIVLVYSIYFM